MEQRLNILFDHLNNEEISNGVIELLLKVATSLNPKIFANATAVNLQIATEHSDEIEIGIQDLSVSLLWQRLCTKSKSLKSNDQKNLRK